jgi:GNAT superfamily N-acetyltransferase
VFVLLADGGDVLGFHALNAASLDYRDLPASFARAKPNHGTIPVAFVAMMGVDARHQGKRLGKYLLSDACSRAVRASENLGLAAIALDVLDCGQEDRVRRRHRFYASVGFQSLPSNPMRMYLPIGAIDLAP